MDEQSIQALLREHNLTEQIFPLNIKEYKRLNRAELYQLRMGKELYINGGSVSGQRKMDIRFTLFQDTLFSHLQAPDSVFVNVHFDGCKFTHDDLSNIQFINCIFNRCTFSQKTDLSHALFINCQIHEMTMEEVELSGLIYYHCMGHQDTQYQKCKTENIESIEKKSKIELQKKEDEKMEQKKEPVIIKDERITDALIGNELLQGVTYHHCVFLRCRFIAASTPTAYQCTLTQCYFLDCQIDGLYFQSDLSGSSFEHCQFSAAFSQCDFKSAKFIRCEVDEETAAFNHCDFTDSHTKGLPVMSLPAEQRQNYRVDEKETSPAALPNIAQMIKEILEVIITQSPELVTEDPLIQQIHHLLNGESDEALFDKLLKENIQSMDEKEFLAFNRYCSDLFFEK